MPVINLERRPPEIGRLRMGEKGTKGEPKRLTKWRLTSANRSMLEAAAQLYGGEVQEWPEQPGQFQLYTDAEELPCMVAPKDISQWYELWSGGGCQRRCDGAFCEVPKGDEMQTVDCLCDPDKRDCKLTTRLSVFLHELPGLGTWRLESHGYFAATEMAAVAETLVAFARRGQMAQVMLAIEQREQKEPGKPVKKFIVPALRVQQSLQMLQTGEVPAALAAPKTALPEPASVTQHQEPRPGPQQRQQAPAATRKAPNLNESGATCPKCNAPNGKPHGKECANATPATEPRSAGDPDRPTALKFAMAAFTEWATAEYSADDANDADFRRVCFAQIVGHEVKSCSELTAEELRLAGNAFKKKLQDFQNPPPPPEDGSLPFEEPGG